MALTGLLSESAKEIAGRMGTPFIDARQSAAVVSESELSLLVVGPHEGVAHKVASDLAAAIRVAYSKSHDAEWVSTERGPDGSVVSYTPAGGRKVNMFEVKSQGYTPNPDHLAERNAVHVKALPGSFGTCSTQLILHAYAERMNQHIAEMHH